MEMHREIGERECVCRLRRRFTAGTGLECTCVCVTSAACFGLAQLWWPADMGAPNLYNITAFFTTSAGAVSDTSSWRFGVRQVTGFINAQGYREFAVNNKPVFVRGGGWAWDLFLRYTEDRLRAEFMYMVHLGLNAVRVRVRTAASLAIVPLAVLDRPVPAAARHCVVCESVSTPRS